MIYKLLNRERFIYFLCKKSTTDNKQNY